MMSLAKLTKPDVEAAMVEYDILGGETFLAKYGYTQSKRYWLIQKGRRYPSKAIAGVAYKYVDGSPGPLTSDDFSGGQATVVRRLRQLGFEVEAPDRNPAWTRDELILALDLYFSNPANPPGKNSTAVAALSAILNKLHHLKGFKGSDTLRNANGVYLKMMNFRAIDSTYVSQGKVGMTRGNALEAVVWKEYDGQRPKLARDAQAIRDAVTDANIENLTKIPSADPYEGEEGGIIVQLHKRYERDPRIVAEKRKAAKLTGDFSCEVCAFDFRAAYGELGADFIEIHHTKPVHLMTAGQKTKLSDLALLCANCHRMAHRRRIPLSLDELKAALVRRG